MSQLQRPRRIYPHNPSWEVPVIAVMVWLVAALVTTHLARTLANLTVGVGWVWTNGGELITSFGPILAGNAGAGLDANVAAAPAIWLWLWLAVTHIALAAVTIKVSLRAWNKIGGGRVLGMATAEEAESLLGERRLYKVRFIIRPDLYSKNTK